MFLFQNFVLRTIIRNYLWKPCGLFVFFFSSVHADLFLLLRSRGIKIVRTCSRRVRGRFCGKKETIGRTPWYNGGEARPIPKRAHKAAAFCRTAAVLWPKEWLYLDTRIHVARIIQLWHGKKYHRPDWIVKTFYSRLHALSPTVKIKQSLSRIHDEDTESSIPWNVSRNCSLPPVNCCPQNVILVKRTVWNKLFKIIPVIGTDLQKKYN